MASRPKELARPRPKLLSLKSPVPPRVSFLPKRREAPRVLAQRGHAHKAKASSCSWAGDGGVEKLAAVVGEEGMVALRIVGLEDASILSSTVANSKLHPNAESSSDGRDSVSGLVWGQSGQLGTEACL